MLCSAEPRWPWPPRCRAPRCPPLQVQRAREWSEGAHIYEHPDNRCPALAAHDLGRLGHQHPTRRTGEAAAGVISEQLGNPVSRQLLSAALAVDSAAMLSAASSPNMWQSKFPYPPARRTPGSCSGRCAQCGRAPGPPQGGLQLLLGGRVLRGAPQSAASFFLTLFSYSTSVTACVGMCMPGSSRWQHTKRESARTAQTATGTLWHASCGHLATLRCFCSDAARPHLDGHHLLAGPAIEDAAVGGSPKP